MEESIYAKRNEEIEIYDINLDYLKNVDYNDIKKKYISQIALFISRN